MRSLQRIFDEMTRQEREELEHRDKQKAVQSLPIPTGGQNPYTLAATGTEGRINLSPNLSPQSAKTVVFGVQKLHESNS